MRNPRARVVDEMREGGGFELSSERKGGAALCCLHKKESHAMCLFVLWNAKYKRLCVCVSFLFPSC